MKQKRIEGYWYNDYNGQQYPMPVANDLPFVGKDEFLSRLSALENIARLTAYRGFSMCRICNCRNGSEEYELGNWVWPQGYSHYIKDHNVLPSPDFMDFVNEAYSKLKKNA